MMERCPAQRHRNVANLYSPASDYAVGWIRNNVEPFPVIVLADSGRAGRHKRVSCSGHRGDRTGGLEDIRPQDPQPAPRLYIKCKRAGEVFNVVYRNGTAFYGDALVRIDYLLRDWHRDAVVRMDRRLIELLANIQQQIGYDNPLTVISAYRTRQTNQQISRAAKNSFHVKGMAVDLRVHCITTQELRKIAKQQRAGGIGYYPNREFVHLDTGPVRSWRG